MNKSQAAFAAALLLSACAHAVAAPVEFKPNTGSIYTTPVTPTEPLPVTVISGGGGGGGGDASAANQTAVQANPGSDASKAVAVQGVTGGKEVPTSVADGSNVAQGAKADSAYAGSGAASLVALGKGIYNAATAPIPAGTAIIGKVGIDQTTPGTTNGVALTAGTAVAGKFGIDQTTPGTTNAAQLVPGTSNGLSILSKQVANNTTSFAVDASAGMLYGIEAFNNSTTIAYIKLYNASQGSTTCGTGTPIYRGMIPAPSSGGGGYVSMRDLGIPFSTAITACVTAGFGDSDTTAPAASTYTINFLYK